MNQNDLKSQVALGEDSRRQFKRHVTNVDCQAAERTSFTDMGHWAALSLGCIENPA